MCERDQPGPGSTRRRCEEQQLDAPVPEHDHAANGRDAGPNRASLLPHEWPVVATAIPAQIAPAPAARAATTVTSGSSRLTRISIDVRRRDGDGHLLGCADLRSNSPIPPFGGGRKTRANLGFVGRRTALRDVHGGSSHLRSRVVATTAAARGCTGRSRSRCLPAHPRPRRDRALAAAARGRRADRGCARSLGRSRGALGPAECAWRHRVDRPHNGRAERLIVGGTASATAETTEDERQAQATGRGSAGRIGSRPGDTDRYPCASHDRSRASCACGHAGAARSRPAKPATRHRPVRATSFEHS